MCNLGYFYMLGDIIMINLIKRAWQASHNVANVAFPIFEIFILFEILLGFLIGFLAQFMSDYSYIVGGIFISYVVFGYQVNLFTSVIIDTPVIYRTNMFIFKKYLLLIFFRTNEMVSIYIGIIMGLMIFNDNSIWKLVVLFLFSIIILVFLIANISQKKLLYMSISLCVFLISLVVVFKYDSMTVMIIVYLLLIVFEIFILDTVIKDSIQIGSVQKTYQYKFGGYLAHFLFGSIKTNYKNLIIYSLIITTYLYLSVHYQLDYLSRGFMLLLPIFIIFEGIIYLQITTQNQNYQAGRVLFLSGTKKKISKVFFNDISYHFFPLFIIYFFISPITLVFHLTNLLQVILTIIWSIFIVFYFDYLEIHTVVLNKIRPNFIEEYLMLIITILLVFL